MILKKLSAVKLLRLIFNFFKKMIYFQVVATGVSLPFLAAHGLSISLLTMVGNIFFMPFLLSFMFIAAAVFFFELAGLPASILHIVLQKITLYWYRMLLVAPASFQIIMTFKQAVLVSGFTLTGLFLIKRNELIFSSKKALEIKEGLKRALPFSD